MSVAGEKSPDSGTSGEPNEKRPDWWGKCCCWRPGWMGHRHDDYRCEFLYEEKQREAARQKESEKPRVTVDHDNGDC
jgi:hypothetical protein